jgi:excisionase family DNA binding protein
MPDVVPQLLTLIDVAERLRVSPHTIRAWVKKGTLRPTRICRRLLFDPSEVRRFLSGSNQAQAAPFDKSV